jgi:hypothetical protein
MRVRILLFLLSALLFGRSGHCRTTFDAGLGLGTAPLQGVEGLKPIANDSGEWLHFSGSDVGETALLLKISRSTNPLWNTLDFSSAELRPDAPGEMAARVQMTVEPKERNILRSRLMTAYIPESVYVVRKLRGGISASFVVALLGTKGVITAETDGMETAVSPLYSTSDLHVALTEVLCLPDGSAPIHARQYLDPELLFLLRAMYGLHRTTMDTGGETCADLAAYFSPDAVSGRMGSVEFQRLLDVMPLSCRTRLQAMTVSRQVVNVALRLGLDEGVCSRIVIDGVPRYGLSRAGLWLAQALFAPDWQVRISSARLVAEGSTCFPDHPGTFTIAGMGHRVLAWSMRANGMVETASLNGTTPLELQRLFQLFFR